MTDSNGPRTSVIWVAYPHPRRGSHTRSAHAVRQWNPDAPSVVAVCGRTLTRLKILAREAQPLTLTPQPDRFQCGLCVDHIGRTDPAAVPHYRPPTRSTKSVPPTTAK